MKRLLLSLLIPGWLVSCTSVTLPLQEYVLARSAMEAAEQSNAERLSTSVFQQAEQVYKEAQSLYEGREYEQARLLFIKARKLAEKAEMAARIKKSKTGEVL